MGFVFDVALHDWRMPKACLEHATGLLLHVIPITRDLVFLDILAIGVKWRKDFSLRLPPSR